MQDEAELDMRRTGHGLVLLLEGRVSPFHLRPDGSRDQRGLIKRI
jgi:hypothetical protein